MDSRLRTMAKGAAARYGGLGTYDVEAEIQRFDVSVRSPAISPPRKSRKR